MQSLILEGANRVSIHLLADALRKQHDAIHHQNFEATGPGVMKDGGGPWYLLMNTGGRALFSICIFGVVKGEIKNSLCCLK